LGLSASFSLFFIDLGVYRELQEAVVWILREKFKRESIDAKHCDGTTRSSDEVSVMEMERRGVLNTFNLLFNLYIKG